MNGPGPVVNCVTWSAACVRHRTDAYDDLRYYYESYRYDRLEDAVNLSIFRASTFPGCPAAGPRSANAFDSWLAKKAVVRLLHGPVTPAGGRLQGASIEDRNMAAPVPDHPPALKLPRGFRDANTAHSQHIGEKVVRETKTIRVGAVVRHQEPAGQARFQQVIARARGRLRELGHQGIEIAIEPTLQCGAPLQFTVKGSGGHA